LAHHRLGAVQAPTIRVDKASPLVLIGLFILAVGTTGHHVSPHFTDAADSVLRVAEPALQELVENAAMQTVAQAAANVQELASSVVTAEPEHVTRIVELGAGRTFARMLIDAAISGEDAFAVSSALGKVFDHRKLKAGQEVALSITRQGNSETLTALTFEPEATKEISIQRQKDGSYLATLHAMPIERKRLAAQGEIRGSLYGAGEKAGVPRAIMAAMLRAYAHEIDFQRDIRAGDRFEVLYDQPSARNGTPVGQGVIIYAALILRGKVIPLYRVTFGDGSVDYFDEKGRSIKRSLLRTPVEGARVSSSFGVRRHPILGYSKMHQGTDFAAPMGTPIFAAGSGTVEAAKFNGSYGRYVKIRHNSRTATAYAHMSRFASDIKPGARVNQGDVIGYVGTSGRSTGPHLHYEVLIDGRQANPMTISMPVGRVLDGATFKQFKQGQEKIKKEFAALLQKNDDTAKEKLAAPTLEEPPASIKVVSR